MKTLTLYPQGIFIGSSPFNPTEHTPVPVRVIIDGFPLQLEIKSLKGLNFWQKKQACQLHLDHYARQGYKLFFLQRGEDLVLTLLEQEKISHYIDLLTRYSFPVASLSLAVFKIAKYFFTPTLHVKALPQGMMRLIYGENKLPYLVRFVNKEEEAQEIQETLHYIKQAFHDRPVQILQEGSASSSLGLTWVRPTGANHLWGWYWWPRALSCLLGVVTFFLGIGSFQLDHQTQQMKEECNVIKTQVQAREEVLEKSPYHNDAQRYDTLSHTLQIIAQDKGVSYKELIKALTPVPHNVQINDLAWWPRKQLKILTSFPSWQALIAYEEFLHHHWPRATIKKNHQPTSSEAMTVQWDIQF